MAGHAPFGHISESDFSSLLEALSSNTKGRAFLNEYRRRFQPEDTMGLLDSLQRIEGSMETVRDQLHPQQIAAELRNIAMSLDLSLDGAMIDEEGDDSARRLALADRARWELLTLASSLAGKAPAQSAAPSDGPAPASPLQDHAPQESAVGYRLRDSAADR